MFDVIVIGAGIAGASCAQSLAKLGAKVQVLERSSIASGASGNPAGILYPFMASDYDYATAFYLQGLAYTISLLHSFGDAQDWYDLVGMLHFPKNSGDLVQCEQLQKLSAKLNLPPQIMSAHENGFLLHASGWVNVPKFCEFMLAQQNISVACGVEVCEINAEKVLANDGRVFSANNIVIANAYEAKKLLPLHHLPMSCIRGQITYLPQELVQNPAEQVLCYGGYITPAINGIHYLGATFDKKRDDLLVDNVSHQQNISLLQAHFPQMLRQNIEVGLLSGRAGFRTVSGDRMPIIGKLHQQNLLNAQLNGVKYSKLFAEKLAIPKVENIYISLCHAARGLVSAPLAGAIIASKIAGLPCNLISEQSEKIFCPERFSLRAWRKNSLN